MARQQDGPYSDIELLCLVDAPEMDVAYEWVYGAGKAEINVLGRNDARWEAQEVAIDWFGVPWEINATYPTAAHG